MNQNRNVNTDAGGNAAVTAGRQATIARGAHMGGSLNTQGFLAHRRMGAWLAQNNLHNQLVNVIYARVGPIDLFSQTGRAAWGTPSVWRGRGAIGSDVGGC